MRLIKYAAAAAALLASVVSANAVCSTVNPAVPATSSNLTSAPIRQNFAAAYTDLNNILGMFASGTAPASPCAGQFWRDTSVNPNRIRQWDGTAWALWGLLDTTGHTFSASLAAGTVIASPPLNASFLGGVATLSLNFDSNFVNSGGNLAFANIPSGSLMANAGAGTAEPTGATPTAWFDRWCSTSADQIPYRQGGGWVCTGMFLANHVWGGTQTFATIIANPINGLTWPSSGNQGGVLYFSGPTTISSSSFLFLDGFVFGGGTTGASLSSTARPTSGQIPIGQSSGPPNLFVFNGDVVNTSTGLMTIQPNVVGFAKIQQLPGLTLMGNCGNALANVGSVSGTGADQVLRVNGAGTTCGFGAIDLSKSAAVGGVLQASSFPALTGDVTTSAGALATVIANGVVTNAKLAMMGAFTIKLNATGSTAAPQDATIGGLTNKATPATSDLLLIQDQAAAGAIKYCTLAQCIGAVASGVTSINGNPGAWTSSNGVASVGNDLRLATIAPNKMLANIGTTTAVPTATDIRPMGPPRKAWSTNLLDIPVFNGRPWNISKGSASGDMIIFGSNTASPGAGNGFSNRVAQIAAGAGTLRTTHPTDSYINQALPYRAGVWGWGGSSITLKITPLDNTTSDMTALTCAVTLQASPATLSNGERGCVINATGGSAPAWPAATAPGPVTGARFEIENSSVGTNAFILGAYLIPDIQLATNTFTIAASGGGTGTHEAVYDGTNVFIVSHSFDRITKHDAATMNRLAVATTCAYPHDVTIVGLFVWVACFNGQAIQKYDRATLTLQNNYPYTKSVIGITTDGTDLFLGAGIPAETPCIVKFTIATTTFSLINCVPNGGLANVPVVIIPGTPGEIWSVNIASTPPSDILRINLGSGATIATINCACGDVYGLGTDGKYIFANGMRGVYVIDPASNTIVDTFTFRFLVKGASNVRMDAWGRMWGTTNAGYWMLDYVNKQLYEVPANHSGGPKFMTSLGTKGMLMGYYTMPSLDILR